MLQMLTSSVSRSTQHCSWSWRQRLFVSRHLFSTFPHTSHTIVQHTPSQGFLFKFYLYIIYFLERGEGRVRKIDAREKHRLVASYTNHDQGIKPTTQVCALTRNQTSDLLLCGVTPDQLSHTGEGKVFFSMHCRMYCDPSLLCSLYHVFNIYIVQFSFTFAPLGPKGFLKQHDYMILFWTYKIPPIDLASLLPVFLHYACQHYLSIQK